MEKSCCLTWDCWKLLYLIFYCFSVSFLFSFFYTLHPPPAIIPSPLTATVLCQFHRQPFFNPLPSTYWNLGLVDLSLGTNAVKTRKPDPGFVLSQPWIQSPGTNTIMKPLLDFIPCPIGALFMGFCLLILLVTSWGMHSHKLETNKRQRKTTTNK